MKLSREEGINSYFMRIFEIRDQLQELGEIMFDNEMTTMVLNALLEEWGNFTSSLYKKKEETKFHKLWYLCKIEETTFKSKSEIGSIEGNQALASISRKKGRFGKFGPRNKRINMDKVR